MTTSFKMLTGGDTIGTERKFQDYYSFVNFARLVFSANKPPKVYDEDSYAFWRRWIIIDFPHQFTDDQKDLNILERLTTDVELSGLLNLALDGLDRVLRNRSFSYDKSVEETTEYYLRAADPVYAFLQDVCETSPSDWVSKDALYEIFAAYSEANNIPVLKPNAFARSLQNQTAVRVSSTRPAVDGKRVTAWQGLKCVKDVKDVKVSNLFKRGKSDGSDSVNKILEKNIDNPDGETDDPWAGMPDYPAKPCHTCGCPDYWPDFKGKRFICSRCLPEPRSNDNAE